MKFFRFFIAISIYISSFIFFGCGTSYRDMSDEEFWNQYEGRIKSKTDSSYIYQVEVFNTDAEYAKIDLYDNPVVSSNFTKILYVNNEGSYDSSLFYTIRLTQKKKGYEKITKPINEEVYLKVNTIPITLNIKYTNVQYVQPLYSVEYGYKNGYYYCDIMCPITYEEFMLMANSNKIQGTLMVNTTVVQLDKNIDGEIKFVSNVRSGDGQIVNRFYNTNPK
jgi:hypothetical protein